LQRAFNGKQVELAMGRVPVYILSGGKSSRFGKDKARALYRGIPILLHIARSFEPFAKNITIVADRIGKYDDLGFRTIIDKTKGLGPIGGLQAAVSDLNDDRWLFLSSCDLLGIKPKWLQILLSGRTGRAQAVAFKGKLWEPMPALYHTSAREVVDRVIIKPQNALWQLFEEIETVSMDYPDDWEKSININTKSDLECFAQMQKNSK
jgi:molybdopterin-guanine dinucleotide biosynthesis protein A